MEKQFVPYELSVKLKSLDYPQNEYFNWYNGNGKLQWDFEYDEDDFSKSCCSAPTLSQAFDWLLKKHNLYAIIIPTITMHWTFKTMTVVEDMIEVPPYKHVDAHDWSTREAAELACLIKLIDIVENK